jgi:hypothetical protein
VLRNLWRGGDFVEEFEGTKVEVLVATYDGDGPEFRCRPKHRRNLDDFDVAWLCGSCNEARLVPRPIEAIGFQLLDADRIHVLAPQIPDKRLTQIFERVPREGEHIQNLAGSSGTRLASSDAKRRGGAPILGGE